MIKRALNNALGYKNLNVFEATVFGIKYEWNEPSLLVRTSGFEISI
jgi:hypothetical protein